MTPECLESKMTRMGDRISYPYWSTQQILWNGEPVTVSAPQPINPPSADEE
jgi:hypothetical protein